MSEHPHRGETIKRVTVEMELDEPALTQAAFELFHTYAQSCGLDDTGRVDVRLQATFEGPAYEQELERFKVKVRDIASAHVLKVEDTGEPYYTVGMLMEDERKQAENS